ncbi:MAG: hypothetical protein QM504_13450 [Pseudomonadota bacterium]
MNQKNRIAGRLCNLVVNYMLDLLLSIKVTGSQLEACWDDGMMLRFSFEASELYRF